MDKLIELIAPSIKKYLLSSGHSWIADHIEVILLALFSTGLITTIYKIVKYIITFSRKRRLARDLHPFLDKSVMDKATEFFVPTKCQNIDPSKEHEPRETHAFATKEKLIPFFTRRAFNHAGNEQRYYLVLADSGMGKTTFMINLYMQYQNQFLGKKDSIKLFPLGDERVDEFIDKIGDHEQLNTILLLDGLDDDSKAWINHENRLNDLMQKVRLFRKVVITCRTQFFPSAEKEPYETGIRKFDTEGGGEYVFRKIYISPFDDDDIKKYLDKKFGRFAFLNRRKKSAAWKIVQKSPNLMVRPMLLSYIDDLVSQPEGTDEEISITYAHTHEIYAVLIDKWIQREAKRVSVDIRQEFTENLSYFSNQVALAIYRNSAMEGCLYIKASDVLSLAHSFEINFDDMELRGRSLLNRDLEGNCKFAHKSILEYFVAANAYHGRRITKDSSDEQIKVISSLDLKDFDQAKIFFVEMCLNFRTLQFDFIPDKHTYDHGKKNISDVLAYIYKNRVPEWIDSRTLLFKKN